MSYETKWMGDPFFECKICILFHMTGPGVLDTILGHKILDRTSFSKEEKQIINLLIPKNECV